MEINILEKQNHVPITIIQPKGEFDSSAVEQFDEFSRELFDSGARDVIIDLSQVPFMSSAGIRSISTMYQMLHPKSSAEEEKDIRKGIRTGTYKAPHLKILKPSKEVSEVMKMVGIDMYIEIFNDENSAISSFVN